MTDHSRIPVGAGGQPVEDTHTKIGKGLTLTRRKKER